MKFTIRAVLINVRSVAALLAAAGLLFVCVAGFASAAAAQTQAAVSDLTVHEWGTFTSIAGKDGQAVEW